jgi:L-seryl-tRNA(Ser) seleniumtransferase
VARALAVEQPELRRRTDDLIRALPGIDAEAVDTVAAVGGGGAPGVELPSVAVSLPAAYAAKLRAGQPPVVGRVVRGRCLLDLRTVDPADDRWLAEAVRRCSS